MLNHAFLQYLFKEFVKFFHNLVLGFIFFCNFMQQCQFLTFSMFSCVLLQRAGLVGAAGLYAARNVVVESRCAAEPASLRAMRVREQLKKDGPATPSPASVSSPVI